MLAGVIPAKDESRISQGIDKALGICWRNLWGCSNDRHKMRWGGESKCPQKQEEVWVRQRAEGLNQALIRDLLGL